MILKDAIEIIWNQGQELSEWLDKDYPGIILIEKEKPWTGSSKVMIEPIRDDGTTKTYPDYEYFLAVFIIDEQIGGLRSLSKDRDIDEMVSWVIHYALFDA